MKQVNLAKKMNEIARNAGKKVKDVALKVVDATAGRYERQVRKMDDANRERNTRMIEENFPGGVEQYRQITEAGQKKKNK